MTAVATPEIKVPVRTTGTARPKTRRRSRHPQPPPTVTNMSRTTVVATAVAGRSRKPETGPVMPGRRPSERALVKALYGM